MKINKKAYKTTTFSSASTHQNSYVCLKFNFHAEIYEHYNRINAIIKDMLLYSFQKYKNDPLLLLSSHTLTCSHIFHKNIFAFGGKYMPYLFYIYISKCNIYI